MLGSDTVWDSAADNQLRQRELLGNHITVADLSAVARSAKVDDADNPESKAKLSSVTPFHAKFWAHELTRRAPADSVDRLATALVDAQVDLNPHQVDAALFAFRSPLSKGVLLADEVGLGKTIEAGRNKAADVRAIPWDLVVMDEAHRLRNVYKPGNIIANTLKQALAHAPKLLLTATPLQNSLLELFGLVSFLDDRVFGDVKSFREQFLQLTEDQVFRTLKARLKPVCQRTLRRQVTAYISYTRRLPMVEHFSPEESEDRLYNAVSDYLRRDNLLALPASQRSLMTLVLRKLLASSTFAIAGALQTLVTRLRKKIEKRTAAESLVEEMEKDFEGRATRARSPRWSRCEGEPDGCGSRRSRSNPLTRPRTTFSTLQPPATANRLMKKPPVVFSACPLPLAADCRWAKTPQLSTGCRVSSSNAFRLAFHRGMLNCSKPKPTSWMVGRTT